MKTAVADEPRQPRDNICTDLFHVAGEHYLRCWKRAGHDGLHMAVVPNRDPAVLTRPQAVRW